MKSLAAHRRTRINTKIMIYEACMCIPAHICKIRHLPVGYLRPCFKAMYTYLGNENQNKKIT